MSEQTMTHDEVLASTFGFQNHEGPSYRAPLPVVGVHTVRTRPCGNIGGMTELQHPPYLTASLSRGGVEVMLCEGDGWRANTHGDGRATENWNDRKAWIYADGDNVPEEWKEPIAKALEEIKAHWPGKRLVFRPDHDGELPG